MVLTYVALLRAVNVGGRAAVSMAALRDLAAALALDEPRTVLQSGNLVFRAKATGLDTLARRLREALSTRLGIDTAVMVRDASAWRAIIDGNPFPDEARADPGHLLVMLLERPATARDAGAVRASIKGRERVAAAGGALYLVYPDGVGRSRLTGAVIEKATGSKGTARNWNTVQKLAALCGDR
jgi:uncharacterized protein (DUF1697 family)